ncbi:MAG: hypothetical protein R3F60_03095 [bacterium]
MTDSTDKNWVPEYKVKVDGQEIQLSDDLFLQSILVDLRRQAPASVEIQFNNKSGTYDNEDQFAPGNEVEVALGYTEQEKKVVFTGEIIGTEVRLSGKSPRIFVVRAFDFLHRMTRGRKTRTFLEQKFSDIVNQLAGDASLSPDVDDTAFTREYVIQHNQTDLDFARGIAGWLDYDLHVRHREGPTKLRFKKPEIGGDAVVKAVFEKPDLPAGDTHLRRFSGRLSLARVVSEVTVRGWNPAEKKEIVGRATSLYGAMGARRRPPTRSSRSGARPTARSSTTRCSARRRPTPSPRRSSTSTPAPSWWPTSRSRATPRSPRAPSSRSRWPGRATTASTSSSGSPTSSRRRSAPRAAT